MLENVTPVVALPFAAGCGDLCSWQTALVKDRRKCSYERGCQEKNSLPSLRGGKDVGAGIQPRVNPGGFFVLDVMGLPGLPERATQWRVLSR